MPNLHWDDEDPELIDRDDLPEDNELNDLPDPDELEDFETYEEFAAYMKGVQAGRRQNQNRRVFHQEADSARDIYDVSDSRWERDEEKRRREKEGRNGRRKERKHFSFGLFILVLFLLAAAAGGFWLYNVFSGIQTVSSPGAFSRRLKENANETTAGDPFMTGFTNIALFGVDSRDNELLSGNNRSDIIMIMSVNNLDGSCKLLSLYRDTYLHIGEDVYTKCNAAYAYGGPEQAVQMLNENLDLSITDFVTIGFGGLADLIDCVGGVTIDVAEDEVHGINDYESTMAQELGREYVPISGPGRQTLTGLQAVAYCRIRYTAGDDFKRTQRQREVLMQTISKVKHASPQTVKDITEKVFKEVATSVTAAEAVPLALQLLRMDIKDTGGFPAEEYRTTGLVNGQDCIIPVTLEQNVVWLHSYLFGDTAYEVSDRVREISERIRSNTGR
ncbi:MAG: LCP family protein [Lachnospiraceae bacterium]|nr:LCP family protein [Lachnospiraceae bacterium]